MEIDLICNLVNEFCGIYFDDIKGYLIESCFFNLMKEIGSDSFDEFV